MSENKNLTKKERENYLERARKVYNFMKGMQDPDTGLIFDGGSPVGIKDFSILGYNQGEMISGCLALLRVTNDQKYLRDALQVANAAIDYYSKFDTSHNGSHFSSTPEPVFFKEETIHMMELFRGLQLVSKFDSNLAIKAKKFMRQYADSKWNSRNEENLVRDLSHPDSDSHYYVTAQLGHCGALAVLASDTKKFEI